MPSHLLSILLCTNAHGIYSLLAGVRARQECVPFATCEDEAEVAASVLALVGQRVHMQATATGMKLEAASAQQHQPTEDQDGAPALPTAAAPEAAATQRVRSLQVLPLRDAVAATSGAKAAACGELLRLAADAAAVPGDRPADSGGPGANGATPRKADLPLFAAPDGVVLPFGCMEAALAADGHASAMSSLQQQLRVLLGSMQRGAPGGNLAALDALCSEIQGLLSSLRIPQNVSVMPLLPRNLCLQLAHHRIIDPAAATPLLTFAGAAAGERRVQAGCHSHRAQHCKRGGPGGHVR